MTKHNDTRHFDSKPNATNHKDTLLNHTHNIILGVIKKTKCYNYEWCPHRLTKVLPRYAWSSVDLYVLVMAICTCQVQTAFLP
jgi:hypothetical protein